MWISTLIITFKDSGVYVSLASGVASSFVANKRRYIDGHLGPSIYSYDGELSVVHDVVNGRLALVILMPSRTLLPTLPPSRTCTGSSYLGTGLFGIGHEKAVQGVI